MAMPLNLPEAHGVRALHFQLLARRDTLLEMLRERMRGVRHPNDDAPPPDTETASEAMLEADLAVKQAELDREASELEAGFEAFNQRIAGLPIKRPPLDPAQSPASASPYAFAMCSAPHTPHERHGDEAMHAGRCRRR